jgi:glucokinase
VTLAIGVDVGGTKIAGGVVDEHGRLLTSTREPTPEDPAALRVAVADVVATLVREAGQDVVAVGVAAAGFVSTDRSTVVSAPNLSFQHEPLGAELARATGLRVVVENDANAAAWGEHRFGAGPGSDLVCVTVGTGIGGGIVVDGRLVRGHWGFAAEVGHIPLVPGGLPCGCGSNGCWEQYGSGTALLRIAAERATADPAAASRLLELGDGTVDGITGDHITAAARDGDPLALAAFTEVGAWSGRGLAVLAAVLDPPVVVIGGGVSEAGAVLLDPIREVFRALHPAGMGDAIAEVRGAVLGNDAGLVGVADLARR